MVVMTRSSITPLLQRLLDREAEQDRMIGVRLRSTREASFLTQRQLATLSGIPEADLADYESGEIPIPLTRLRLIAAALDTDAVTLLTHLLFPT